MTGGILEDNLNSLHLREGSDFYHFNWLLQPRKNECATLMNLVVKSSKWPSFLFIFFFLPVPHLKWYQWPEPLGDLSVQYEATRGDAWTSARTSPINKARSQNMRENKGQPCWNSLEENSRQSAGMSEKATCRCVENPHLNRRETLWRHKEKASVNWATMS